MGLMDVINKKNQEPVDIVNQLNTQELEFLLGTLKNSSLKGDQVEVFYNLVLKLQNQYISLTNKK